MEPSEKEAIRARVDLIDLISRYTVLKQVGSGKWKGLCPFHNEKTPSFNVDPERGRWHCFGSCGEGGDVFKFLEKAENLTFIEAAERLAAQAGITLTRGNASEAERAAAQSAQQERDRIFAANDEAMRFFRNSLGRARLAQEYAEQRGLAHQTLQDFGIGFAPDDWGQLAEYLLRRGVHPEDAEKAGLIFPSRRGDGYTDKFRGRLMFPIVDVQERVTAFGGRLIVPAPPGITLPKYLNSPETPVFSKSKILYGLNRARKAIAARDLVLVVEGYMDVVACHQAGIEFVVATLGTSLTDEHVRMIRRYTKNVVLSFDADDAGVKAALRAASLFEANAQGGDFTLKALILPEGDDPDSMLIQRGDVAGFHRAIDRALSIPEFRLLTLKRRFDTKTEHGKSEFLREAVGVIAEIRSGVEQDRIISRLAPLHPSFASSGASRIEESIRAEVRRHRAEGRPRPSYEDPGENELPFEEMGPPLRGPILAAPRREARSPYSSSNDGFSPRSFNRPPTVLRPYGDSAGAIGIPLVPSSAPEIAPSVDAAAEKAERTVLRGLLSDEWGKRICSILTTLQERQQLELSDLFTDFGTVLLTEKMLEMIGRGYLPSRALMEMSDDPISSFADTILLEDEAEPLAEQAIADCLKRLQNRRNWGEIREIEAQFAGDAEGNAVSDDELLRRWERKVRTAKQGGDASTSDHHGSNEDSAR